MHWLLWSVIDQRDAPMLRCTDADGDANHRFNLMNSLRLNSRTFLFLHLKLLRNVALSMDSWTKQGRRFIYLFSFPVHKKMNQWKQTRQK